MGDVIAVCGLNREGRLLRGAGVRVIAGGGDPVRLAETLAREAAGADGIISFGMAGALDPGLRIGDWVIGEGLSGAYTGACDGRWAAALGSCLVSVVALMELAGRAPSEFGGRNLTTIAMLSVPAMCCVYLWARLAKIFLKPER